MADFPKQQSGFATRPSEFASEQGRIGGKKAQAGGKAHRYREGSLEAETSGSKGGRMKAIAWRIAKEAFQRTVIDNMRQKLSPDPQDEAGDNIRAEIEAKAVQSRIALDKTDREYKRLMRGSVTPRIEELVRRRTGQGAPTPQPVEAVESVVEATEILAKVMPSDVKISTGNVADDVALDAMIDQLTGSRSAGPQVPRRTGPTRGVKLRF